MTLSTPSLLENCAVSSGKTQEALALGLKGATDGELFIEYRESESISLDDSTIKSSTANISQGFGLRALDHDTVAYAHSSEMTSEALLRAAGVVSSLGAKGNLAISTAAPTPHQLYSPENPLPHTTLTERVDLLGAIDLYLRRKDPRVKQVAVNLNGSWQRVNILKMNGFFASDDRPFVSLSIVVTVEKDGRQETAHVTAGGRRSYGFLFEEARWQAQADEALRKTLVNLDAIGAPAGEMAVVLGGGNPGILLHEAVGHGLEGDFNRKGSSTFSGRIGEQVAAKGVTIVDAGNLTDDPHAHGNLHMDDEGTPSGYNVLIEDGVLKGYMHDRMNAQLMGHTPTGNSRRQNYMCTPMPRMTNTFMLGGDHTQEEMIRSVKRGIYAVSFSGGQVDITSGKFVFTTDEAYLIEDGVITAPVKGATLIGSGPETMKNVTMVGNDLSLNQGIGMCGKDGQSVLVGLGQPSALISKMTVGGTQ